MLLEEMGKGRDDKHACLFLQVPIIVSTKLFRLVVYI